MPGQDRARSWPDGGDVHGSEATRARSTLFAPTRDRLLLLAWTVALCFVGYNVYALLVRGWMVDAVTYWSVWTVTPMYGGVAPGLQGAYLYSPAFAQVIWPLTLLPWWAFSAVWFTSSCIAYAWLVQPLRAAWAVPLLALALEDILLGNTTWILALACAVGFRVSSGWLPPTLVKVTPAVALAWFAARGDARSVLRAAIVLGVVLGLSFAAAPDLWAQWWNLLTGHRGTGITVRVVAALVVVVVAARTERPVWVLVALVIASPVVEPYSLAVFCALPRLVSPETLERAARPFGGVVTTFRRALDLT